MASCEEQSRHRPQTMAIAAVKAGKAVSVLVAVSGADPKFVKAKKHPFHRARDGSTTLSNSGVLVVYGKQLYVLTSLSAVVPFLQESTRDAVGTKSRASLLPATRVQVTLHSGTVIAGQYLGAFQVEGLQPLAESLLQVASAAGEQGLQYGWTLGSVARVYSPEIFSCVGVIAVPQCPARILEEAAKVAWNQDDLHQGACITLLSAPFGVLSPPHFLNSASMGVVSNSLQGMSLRDAKKSLLMATDVRCLPGSEGGPVFDAAGQVAGMAALPLSAASVGAEVGLVIPASAVLSGFRSFLEAQSPSSFQLDPQPANNASASALRQRLPHASHPQPDACLPAFQQPHGLDAPDRADNGRAITSGRAEPQQVGCALAAAAPAPTGEAVRRAQRRMSHLHASVSAAAAGAAAVDMSLAVRLARRGVAAVLTPSGHWASGIVVNRRGIVLTNAHLFEQGGRSTGGGASPQRVRVRVAVDQDGGSEWFAGTVLYIFQGALDLAVIQVMGCRRALWPLTLCGCEVPRGSAVLVMGHALFNPLAGLQPAVTAGIVAQLVALPGSSAPAMMLTTATVHAGASGGAVLTPAGTLAAIVTSNAKHSVTGGTIPTLNFSIPAAALQDVWALLSSPLALDMAALRALDTHNKALADIWALDAPYNAVMPLLPSADGSQAGKGTRFTQFLQESLQGKL